MSRRKARTSITIPAEMLADLDRKAAAEGRTRSDLVREAVASYFASEEDGLLAEAYREMGGKGGRDGHDIIYHEADSWPEWRRDG